MPPSRRAWARSATARINAVAPRWVAVVAVVVSAAVAPGSAAASTPAATTPSPRTSTGQGTLTRVAGSDRISTSILISQTGFPTNLSASAVVLARADDFADGIGCDAQI